MALLDRFFWKTDDDTKEGPEVAAKRDVEPPVGSPSARVLGFVGMGRKEGGAPEWFLAAMSDHTLCRSRFFGEGWRLFAGQPQVLLDQANVAVRPGVSLQQSLFHFDPKHAVPIVLPDDPDGAFLILEAPKHQIRKVYPQCPAYPEGHTEVFAGATGQAGDTDGPLLQARFINPTYAALYWRKNVRRLYISCAERHVIRVVDLINNTVSTLGTPCPVPPDNPNSRGPNNKVAFGEMDKNVFDTPKVIVAHPSRPFIFVAERFSMRVINLDTNRSALWHGARECNNLIAFETGVLVNLHTYTHKIEHFYIVGTHPSLPPERPCYFCYESGALYVLGRTNEDKERLYKAERFATPSTTRTLDLTHVSGDSELSKHFASDTWSVEQPVDEHQIRVTHFRLNRALMQVSPLSLAALRQITKFPAPLTSFVHDFLFGYPLAVDEPQQRQDDDRKEAAILTRATQIIGWISALRKLGGESAPLAKDYIQGLEALFYEQGQLLSERRLCQLLKDCWADACLPDAANLFQCLAACFAAKETHAKYFMEQITPEDIPDKGRYQDQDYFERFRQLVSANAKMPHNTPPLHVGPVISSIKTIGENLNWSDPSATCPPGAWRLLVHDPPSSDASTSSGSGTSPASSSSPVDHTVLFVLPEVIYSWGYISAAIGLDGEEARKREIVIPCTPSGLPFPRQLLLTIVKYLHGATVNFGSLPEKDKVFVLRDGAQYRITSMSDKKAPIRPFEQLVAACRQVILGVDDTLSSEGDLTIKDSKNTLNIHNSLRKIRGALAVYVDDADSQSKMLGDNFMAKYAEVDLKKPVTYLKNNFNDLVRVPNGKQEFRQLPFPVKHFIQPTDITVTQELPQEARVAPSAV